MRERAKILVGNREVAKRYLGDRLVWSGGSPIIFEGILILGAYGNNYYIGPIEKDVLKNISEIKAFQIEGKDVFKLARYEFRYLYNGFIGISVHEPGIQEYFEIPPNYKSSKNIKIKLLRKETT